jgi:hypothetical protein
MFGTSPLIEPRKTREMICVCCNCQREKITSDEWRDRTPQPGERLTHGICPECLDTLYPDLAPLIRAG